MEWAEIQELPKAAIDFISNKNNLQIVYRVVYK